MSSFTKTIHKAPYPAISPTLPALSQSGKTVLISGGSTGIGYAIARSFVQASASKIIILGRRADLVTSACSKISEEMGGSKTEIIGRRCDVSDTSSVTALWANLEQEGTIVDVLVLNAARITVGPVLGVGKAEVWADYITNVQANLGLVESFYKQKSQIQKFLVNVSTMAIHDFAVAGHQPTYSATKGACTLLLQQIAKDTTVDEMQIVSFHPGGILTESARKAGYTEGSFPWDDENLPGHFAVWAASPEAAFLHGRFVWAAWDIDELCNGEIRTRLANDPDYLKVGVKGL